MVCNFISLKLKAPSHLQQPARLHVSEVTSSLLAILYHRIAQIFRWIKISLNAQTLYWYKNFTEFNFARSASCSPGSSGWSSQMNTPRLGPNIECTSAIFARAYSAHDQSLAS